MLNAFQSGIGSCNGAEFSLLFLGYLKLDVAFGVIFGICMIVELLHGDHVTLLTIQLLLDLVQRVLV